MEVGDDVEQGQNIQPDSYRPRNLQEDLRVRGKIPLAECVDVGLQLSATLRILHQELGLVHRDVKPQNIIFVRGVPKLADVGLVKGKAEKPNDQSYVGTEGFIPPEGAGTPQADIYSLGKVLYEMSMGLDRTRFPDPSDSFVERPNRKEWRALYEIIMHACEPNPRKRYTSANELEADLKRLKRRLERQA
jgi:serine/threonine protein kinase